MSNGPPYDNVTPLVTRTEVEVGSRRTASPTTNVSDVRGGGAVERLEDALTARGISASLDSLLENASKRAIRATIEWWDAEPDLGPGVLVEVIRRGGYKPKRDIQAEQDAYQQNINEWLRENFPEVCDERTGKPHPAAWTAVWKLHAQHGVGSITIREHGRLIRGAIKAWDEKWGGEDSSSSTEEVPKCAQ